MSAHGSDAEPDVGLAVEPDHGLDVERVGERIEALLTASSAHGLLARERSEELVRLVVDLYGAGLERILDLLHEAGGLGPQAQAALAGDRLVSSLLMVHGLHPYSLTGRVQQALDEVRPYLGQHDGDVELLGITPQGMVRVRLLGSCDGCAASSVTLENAVRTAVQEAAPEVIGIEVDAAAPPGGPSRHASSGASVIPVDALRARIALHEPPGECPVPGRVQV